MTDTADQAESPPQGHGGSLADMVVVPPEPKFAESFPPAAWLKLAVAAGILIAMNYRQFPRLLWGWIDDDNWSHGFLIPLFSLYLLYSRRDELVLARRRTCLWGLAALVVAAILEILAYNDGNSWACQVGMLMLAFSLVFYLAGPEMVRLTWLPIFFLVFAFPFPGIYYTRLAFPLQNLAASASASLLQLFNVDIVVEKSSLWIVSLSGVAYDPLTVAEACSGVRLLMAFLALGVAMAYLADRPIWQRVVLVAVAVPIAILCNILRVVITCTMYVIDMPQLGQRFMHEFTGMLMLIPAMAMLWALGWLLRHLIVEVDEAEADVARPGRGGNQA